MSNPTTPFSWQMPTATDLVTDLPADFEVFGQAVATSMADLLGGTTGQVLSKTSNTDMDFTWTSPNPGDITGVTAGVGISGGGTSGDVTVTNSMATAMTTSGDLIQATGSGTFARLGTGTNGQYLTTNGTTNSWGTISAGGMTLLSTTTLSGASTTISSISGAYTNLFIYAYGVNLSLQAEFWVAPNAVTNLGYTSGTESSTAWNYINARVPLSRGNTGSAGERVTNARTDNAFSMVLQNYASAASHKTTNINSAYYVTNNGAITPNNAGGSFASTTAVTSLVFSPSTGVFNAGTVLLYGVK